MRESTLKNTCIYCVFSDYMLNCDTWNNQYSVNGARGDGCAFILQISPDSVNYVKGEFGEGDDKISLDVIAERAKKYQPKPKITYKMIQEYVEQKYGFRVYTA